MADEREHGFRDSGGAAFERAARLWQVARTPAEVRTWMNIPLTSGPRLVLNFNEGHGIATGTAARLVGDATWLPLTAWDPWRRP